VERFDEELTRFVEQMWVTMYHAKGVGLAAPQVDQSVRVFVMDCAYNEEHPRRFVCVNPTLHNLGELMESSEGCLSFPMLQVEVPRHKSLTLRAFDEHGEPFELELEGLEAVCAQHETDHLNGESFLDRLGPVERKATLLEYATGLDELLRGLPPEVSAEERASLEEALRLSRELLMNS
jgi:peptide deformylase